MNEIILHKLLTLEVIVETIIDELIDKKLIDADTFDVALIEKIKEIELNKYYQIDKFLDDANLKKIIINLSLNVLSHRTHFCPTLK